MKRRSRGQEFKSTLLHTSVSRVSEMAENRSKSARVRAIYDHAWTRRTPPAARIARIRQNLSARDFAGSMEIRRIFAIQFRLGNRPIGTGLSDKSARYMMHRIRHAMPAAEISLQA